VTGLRPPEHYLLERSVVVPYRIAAWIDRELGRRRVDVRGADAQLDSVLNALARAGAEWRERHQLVSRTEPAGCAVGSADTTGLATTPQPVALSQRLAPAEVADLLNLSSEAIRKACRTGRLKAERVGDRWEVSREDAEHYRAARALRGQT
jgi:excisionase family DNA binding protein